VAATTLENENALGLSVNGRTVDAPVDGGISLARYLRDALGLTGTKIGCGQGECGACTVLVDNMAVCACLYPVGRAQGRKVETVEGLDDDQLAVRLRAELIARGAFQCGFCTPGVLASLVALFRRVSRPDEAEIREALQGNVCRCSGYIKLFEAALAARPT
jgi:aerobic-type carbon monoxide dehydrogenase small subunit (CoxS/CutS family)